MLYPKPKATESLAGFGQKPHPGDYLSTMADRVSSNFHASPELSKLQANWHVMSMTCACSLCRLPFLEQDRAFRTHPKLSADEVEHLRTLMGNMHSMWTYMRKDAGGPMIHSSGDQRGAVMMTTTHEENRHSMMLLHTACLEILRAVCEKQYYSDQQLSAYLFLPLGSNGLAEGVDFRYRRFDIEKQWQLSYHDEYESGGQHLFSWDNLLNVPGVGDWIGARPDRLPMLAKRVDPARLPPKRTTEQSSPFLRLLSARRSTAGTPSLMSLIAARLELDDLMRFVSTCTAIRRQALLQWQPVFKQRVLELSWAAAGIVDGPARKISPSTCDWQGYLVELLSPKYKRNYLSRRRIAMMAYRIKKVADAKEAELKKGRGRGTMPQPGLDQAFYSSLLSQLGMAGPSKGAAPKTKK